MSSGFASLGGDLSAKQVLLRIEMRGVSDTSKELFSQPNEWAQVISGVASGNAEWLLVATRLLKSADAAAAETLLLSLGEALESSAERVLELGATKNISLDRVCSVPDIDDPRFNSQELALAAIAKRQSAVSLVDDPALKNERSLCLRELMRARPLIEGFFGDKP